MTNETSFTLNGKVYDLPKLTIKQNRHVEPLAARHRDIFENATKGGFRLSAMTDDVACDFTMIVYHCLTRVQPDLKIEDFENWEISMTEIIKALPVCLNQSGLFKAIEATNKAPESLPATGEAQSQSTGTESSPNSVTA